VGVSDRCGTVAEMIDTVLAFLMCLFFLSQMSDERSDLFFKPFGGRMCETVNLERAFAVDRWRFLDR